MTKERLTAFVDAVIAIIMTILVLSLSQPSTPTLAGIWELRREYLAYITSFVLCAGAWINHHHTFQLVRKVNGRVLWSNMAQIFSYH